MKILLLIFFVAATKLPSVFVSDIQLWDEGMYAVRVLSIHLNGDFWDQSSHSVAGLDSGSHPPLLIWIGYTLTKIFGLSDWLLKLIPFVFSLAAMYVTYLIGKDYFSGETGLYAVMLFASTILFNIFSKRFQLDMPLMFFMLSSFYFFIKAENTKFILLSGAALGLALMTKALAGLILPIVLISAYLLNRNTISLRKIIIVSLLGLCIALPWHLFMFLKHGENFLQYIFGFHIFQRAVYGVDDNTKPSGVFYFLILFVSILPFALLIITSVWTYYKTKLLLSVWFIVPFVIISLFKTKLEPYLLLALPQACILISAYLLKKFNSLRETKICLFLFAAGILLFFVMQYRLLVKENLPAAALLFFTIIAVIYFAILNLTDSNLNLNKYFKISVFVFFLASNIYYIIFIPPQENQFKLSIIKNIISNESRSFVYAAPQYKYNPQVSYYFEGADIGWENSSFKMHIIETDSVSSIKDTIALLNESFILVEKDNINRGNYLHSSDIIPEGYSSIYSTHGYELFQKK